MFLRTFHSKNRFALFGMRCSNPADPDASYNAHRGLGDMAQFVETYSEEDDPAPETAPRSPDLITHVTVHKMTVPDGASFLAWKPGSA